MTVPNIKMRWSVTTIWGYKILTTRCTAVAYPRKFMITRWSTRLHRTKSAKALSGGRSLNSLLSLFTWMRRQTASTALPMHERTPERKELKGNDPTNPMYATWIMAVASAQITYRSIILRFVGVAAYALFRDWIRSFASPVALGILKKWCLLLEAKWKGQEARHNQIAWTLAKQIKYVKKNINAKR